MTSQAAAQMVSVAFRRSPVMFPCGVSSPFSASSCSVSTGRAVRQYPASGLGRRYGGVASASLACREQVARKRDSCVTQPPVARHAK